MGRSHKLSLEGSETGAAEAKPCWYVCLCGTWHERTGAFVGIRTLEDKSSPVSVQHVRGTGMGKHISSCTAVMVSGTTGLTKEFGSLF